MPTIEKKYNTNISLERDLKNKKIKYIDENFKLNISMDLSTRSVLVLEMAIGSYIKDSEWNTAWMECFGKPLIELRDSFREEIIEKIVKTGVRECLDTKYEMNEEELDAYYENNPKDKRPIKIGLKDYFKMVEMEVPVRFKERLEIERIQCALSDTEKKYYNIQKKYNKLMIDIEKLKKQK